MKQVKKSAWRWLGRVGETVMGGVVPKLTIDG